MGVGPLHHSEHGKGPPLVLLHPIGLDHTFWPGLVERCAATHRVLALDLPGHGRSPAIADATVAAYAEAVAQTLDSLMSEPAVVLGLSFGGMIAQELAIRHPARVAKLIACACGARIPPEAREAVRGRGTAALEGGMTAVVKGTLERWFTPAFMAAPMVTRVLDRLLADDPRQWKAGWEAIAGHDTLDRLPGITRPALVLVGESDLGTPVPAARALADALPDARFIVVPGAPHMVQLECAETFVDHIATFLDEAR